MNEYIDNPDAILEQQELETTLDIESEEQEPEVTETDHQIVEMFTDNWAKAQAKWEGIYQKTQDDWNVYLGNQWTESSKQARGNRPKVTVDITRKFVKSVVAETYRNPPAVKLTARNEDSSAKAKALSDAIRYYEDYSGAKYIYTHAKECAAVGGIGWVKVSYKDSADQETQVLTVEKVEDPLSIYLDAESLELDGSDANYIIEKHGKVDKEEKFTYWWKNSEGQVNWALISNDRVEDKGVWPDSHIPLVPCFGEYYNIMGNTTMFGIIRQIKDTQRSFNYVLSEGMERLALTPKDPIIAEEGSISQAHLKDWQESATKPKGILFFKGKDNNGQPNLPPSRNNTTPDTSWLSPMVMQLQENAKDTTGIYDTALGQSNANLSGIAQERIQDQGDRGQLVYDEHTQIMIKQVGKCLLGLIPTIIEPSGLLPTLSEEGVNGVVEFGVDPYTGQPINPEIIDLDTTALEISISAGQAFATRKKECLEKITEMFKVLPPEDAQKLVPQLIRDMGFPNADAYAEILDPTQEGAENPQFIMQQLQEAQANAGAMEQQLNEAAQTIQSLQIELQTNTNALLQKAQMDNQTKLTIESMDNDTKIAVEQMKLTGKVQGDETKASTEYNKQYNENLRTSAKLQADQENKLEEIAVKTRQQEQDLIDKIEVQPVAVVEENLNGVDTRPL